MNSSNNLSDKNLNNNKSLSNSKEDAFYEVRNSSIDNKGVFAIKFIPKKTRILQYKGDILEDGPDLDERYKKQISEGKFYFFELDVKRTIDGSVIDNDAKYVNHSCNPNCKTIIHNEEIWYVAKRDIRAGEELSVDYRYEIINPIEKCRCNSRKCRGYILAKRYVKEYKKELNKKEEQKNQ